MDYSIVPENSKTQEKGGETKTVGDNGVRAETSYTTDKEGESKTIGPNVCTKE